MSRVDLPATRLRLALSLARLRLLDLPRPKPALTASLPTLRLLARRSLSYRSYAATRRGRSGSTASSAPAPTIAPVSTATKTRAPITFDFERLREVDVRYGRARLTLARFDRLTREPLRGRIEDFAAGSLDAVELCRVFARERVLSHSPSFRWQRADLSLLLDRIVAVSTHPEFSSSACEDIAAALVDALHAEREAEARMAKRTSDWVKRQRRQNNLIYGSYLDVVGLAQTALRATAPEREFLATHRAILGFGKTHRPSAEFAEQAAASIRLTSGAISGTLSHEVTRTRYPHAAALISGFDLAALGLGPTLAGRSISAMLRHHLDPSPWPQLLATEGFAKAIIGPAASQWLRDGGAFDRLGDHTRKWIEALKRSYPANWRDLEAKELDRAVALMLETGLNLAWVPRPAVLRELLAADSDAARTQVIDAHAPEIIADIEAALAGVESSGLCPTVEACEEAIATYGAGHPKPALAYASTALTDLVHGYFEESNFGGIRRIFGGIDPLSDVGVADFPLFAVGRVWVRANEHFEGNPDPGYNRNRTLHLIGAHYSVSNLLAVLMLLAGLLRELQRFERRSAARRVQAAAAAA